MEQKNGGSKPIKLTTVDIWAVYFTYTLTQTLVCIYLFITQPSIYGVIVYFLLRHESLNYSTTIDWHYTMGLVSRLSVTNTQGLIDMRDNNARMVCLGKETLCNNGENKAWFGNCKLQ